MLARKNVYIWPVSKDLKPKQEKQQKTICIVLSKYFLIIRIFIINLTEYCSYLMLLKI